MNQKYTIKEQSEETSGMLVAIFAIAVLCLAVLACVVVTMLTVKSSGNVPPAISDVTDAGPGSTQKDPTFDSTPVFAPSAATVRPYTTENTKADAATDSAYAVLVDCESGEILAGKNADQRFNPASMTKVMTLIVACERLKQGDLSQNVTFTEDIRSYVRPNSGGYKGASCHWADVGDGATLLDQLYGIAVESAADCTVMVACYVVGRSAAESEAQFVAWMNETVAQMGLENTHFDNLIGHESDNNYTTASDMAAIMLRALECPLIVELLSTPMHTATAFGYNSEGKFVTYRSQFYSTLFNANPDRSSRIKAYEEKVGKFTLTSLTFKGGKTGSLSLGSSSWTYSLVSFAVNGEGKIYVVVTANVTTGYSVIKDAKLLYDTYAK